MYKSLIHKLMATWVVLWFFAWGGLIYSYTQGVALFASPSDRHPAILALMFFASIMGITVLLAAIGMWIYIYRDSGLRGMNQAVWTLIAIFTPNLLGIVIYLILRKPLLVACPGCRAQVEPHLIHCPHCGHILKRKCSGCSAVVEAGFRYCGTCGAQVQP
jgi:hypothetical protein